MGPALDVASVFPLCAITLGNNLMGTFYGEGSHLSKEDNSKIRIFFRLIASFPPIIGACFLKDLGIITDFAGAVGFVIAFSFPALIYLGSKRKINSAFGYNKSIRTTRTYYRGYGSNDVCAALICLFGAGMATFTLISMFQ